MITHIRTLTADRGDAGLRVDLVLRRHLTDVRAATRTRVQAWIGSGKVAINGRIVSRASARAAHGDVVTVRLPAEEIRADAVATRRPRSVMSCGRCSMSSTKTTTCWC